MTKKPPTEKETRKNLIGWSRLVGCEADMLKIFARFDDALKGCKTPQEREAVSAMGIMEVERFFRGRNLTKEDFSNILLNGVPANQILKL
jgi:hypothetical protein